MTLLSLIKLVDKLETRALSLGLDPATMEVVLSRDAEGNSYSPLDAAEICCYVPTNSWSGTVLSPDDQDSRPDNAVCLWPAN